MTSREIAEKWIVRDSFSQSEDYHEDLNFCTADISAAILDAKREQAVADCKAVCVSCHRNNCNRTITRECYDIRAAWLRDHGEPLEVE